MLDASDCEVLMSGIADGINSENAFLSVAVVSQHRWLTTATKVH
ncbi:propionate kinase domain protein [Escherichia coli 2741950]|nr:propionate kinase domain protein [Escherichia coli 2741950]